MPFSYFQSSNKSYPSLKFQKDLLLLLQILVLLSWMVEEKLAFKKIQLSCKKSVFDLDILTVVSLVKLALSFEKKVS